MAERAAYAGLANYVYKDFGNPNSTQTIPLGWTQVDLNGDGKIDNRDYRTSWNGFAAAAYRNSTTGEIVISYRGSTHDGLLDSFGDWVLSNGAQASNIVQIQFSNAVNFYKEIYDMYGPVPISLTGHSLGGALAQLVGAYIESGQINIDCGFSKDYTFKYQETYSFNGYGVSHLLNNIGIIQTSFSSIHNYVNMSDVVGNLANFGIMGTHLGSVDYIYPTPILNNDPFYSHSQYTDAPLSPKPNFTSKEGRALWAYDVSNFAGGLLAPDVIWADVTETDLHNAVDVLRTLDSPKQILHYRTYEGDIIIGTDKIDDLEGTNDKTFGGLGQDTIYGNGGYDLIYGYKGDDYLDGGTGSDNYYFYAGDGHDTIVDTDEYFATVGGSIDCYSKNGSVYLNGNILGHSDTLISGGYWDGTAFEYYDPNPLNSGVTYKWNREDGSDLIIEYNLDQITVKNFNNGDLGIRFDQSETDDPSKIPPQLARDKKAYADDYFSGTTGGVTGGASSLSKLLYKDPTGLLYDVYNCEKTAKILDAYGDNIQGAIVDSSKLFILNAAGTTLKVTPKPVDYSAIVEEARALAQGQQVKAFDYSVPDGITIPVSSSEGSPTLKNIYYQYTSKPRTSVFSTILSIVSLATTVIGLGIAEK